MMMIISRINKSSVGPIEPNIQASSGNFLNQFKAIAHFILKVLYGQKKVKEEDPGYLLAFRAVVSRLNNKTDLPRKLLLLFWNSKGLFAYNSGS
jgi:hypothetical protein